MALLGLIWVIVFCYTPMYGIQLAFKDYDFTKGLTGGDWAGIKYFMMYFNSPAFATTMRNTFVIAFFSIVVGFPLPIILALAINQLKKGAGSADYGISSLLYFYSGYGRDAQHHVRA